jgi:site-specific DNA-methyltransferase (adenine-specific)
MKQKYIPHLAEFFFQPDFSWTLDQANSLYTQSPQSDRIHYSDCIAGMHAMDAESVDLIIADSPFGINFTGKEAMYNRNTENVIKAYHEIDTQDYFDFSQEWIAELPRIMKKDASAYLFSGYTNLEAILAGIRKAGLTTINHCIWQYQFGLFTSRKFVSAHYHLLLVAKSPHYYFNRIKHYQSDIWSDLPRTYKRGELKNGTKLPEKLVQRCLDYSSQPGDLILDPFLGNGTTAIVAKKTFRHYVGFEINRKMRPIITKGLKNAVLGEGYIPYADLVDSPEVLKERVGYRRAYQKYLKLKMVNCST